MVGGAAIYPPVDCNIWGIDASQVLVPRLPCRSIRRRRLTPQRHKASRAYAIAAGAAGGCWYICSIEQGEDHGF